MIRSNTEIGAAIRGLRRAAGLTQVGLAKSTGVNRPSLVNIEAGRQNIHLWQLDAIARVLGVTIGTLIGQREGAPLSHVMLTDLVVGQQELIAKLADLRELNAQLLQAAQEQQRIIDELVEAGNQP
jgi:transcriptional regulator with XRE-family HTH domain